MRRTVLLTLLLTACRGDFIGEPNGTDSGDETGTMTNGTDDGDASSDEENSNDDGSTGEGADGGTEDDTGSDDGTEDTDGTEGTDGTEDTDSSESDTSDAGTSNDETDTSTDETDSTSGPDPIQPGEPCNPLEDVCTENYACWHDDDKQAQTPMPFWSCEYHPEDFLAYGDECDYDDECYGTGKCLDSSHFTAGECMYDRCCTKWCDAVSGLGCPGGMTCIPVYNGLGEPLEIGFCRVL